MSGTLYNSLEEHSSTTSSTQHLLAVGDARLSALPPTTTTVAYTTDSASRELTSDGVLEPQRRVSPIRRLFCLLTLFDFIFTCIIWIFYTQLIGLTPLSKAFENQILKYDFRYSVFDIVVLSFLRFVILVVFYAGVRINNPAPVAVVTALSSLFVILKIIFYDFHHRYNDGSPFDYLIFIATFVMVWMETFLLDCRVLPMERLAVQQTVITQPPLNERTGLLAYHSAWAASTVVPTEGFLTPDNGSLEGSDEETDSLTKQPLVSHELLAAYRVRADKLAEEAWELLDDKASWVVQNVSNNGHRILSQSSRYRKGKAWRLEISLPISADQLFSDFWDGVDRQAEWNKTLLFSRSVLCVDDHIGLVHNAVVEAAGGIIKSRDFVTLRVRCQRDNVLYTAGASVEYPGCPDSRHHTRGENYPGCIACIPINSSSCTLVWIMDSDIKGWIPSSIIDQAMTGVLHQLAASLSNHVATLNQSLQSAPVIGV